MRYASQTKAQLIATIQGFESDAERIADVARDELEARDNADFIQVARMNKQRDEREILEARVEAAARSEEELRKRIQAQLLTIERFRTAVKSVAEIL